MIGLIILLVVVGFGLYLLGMAPIDPTMKRIIQGLIILVVVVYVIIFLAGMLGMSTGLSHLR